MEEASEGCKYERKLLFLYPDLSDNCAEDGSDAERAAATHEEISHLVNYLNYICDRANGFMKDLFASGNFVSSDCVTSVEMKSVSRNPSSLQEPDPTGVRVCITEYDGVSFETYYEAYTKQDARKEHDISHLLAVKLITGGKQSPARRKSSAAWETCLSHKYDAEITVTVDGLTRVLCGIMLDIALYHYFQLPGEYESRFRFGAVKRDYLEAEKSSTEMVEIYGSEQEKREEILYLPASQVYIAKIFESMEAACELVSFFRKLIHQCVLDQVVISQDGRSMELISCGQIYLDDYRNLRNELFKQLKSADRKKIIEDFQQIHAEKPDVSVVLLLCRKAVFGSGRQKKKYYLTEDLNPDTYWGLNAEYVMLDVVGSPTEVA